MTVHWRHRIWKATRPATSEEVAALEEELSVTLPDDYKRVAVLHQGMAPDPCVLDIGTGNTVICELLTISKDPEFRAYSMAHACEHFKPHLPAGVYPFASTGAGDLICFDYREAAHAPKVIFYFTEEAGKGALHPVADSFTDFLSMLHD
ncbi:MAG: SMI1/KNR4 family protein [Myxococcaceae bacterium]|nr:SMI1/KNR4 family protein [Myxococcaceae bacterium]